MAYFNKKVKILSGGSNVKIFNPRNAVDLRSNSTVKKKVNLPTNNGTGTFLSGTQAGMCVDNKLSNTRGCLNTDNSYVNINSGQMQSVGGGYEKNPFRYRKPYSSVPQGKSANAPYQDPTQFYNTAKPPTKNPDKPNNIDQSLWDKLMNLLGRTADSWNTIPAGVGSLIVNVGEGTENLGSGIGSGVAGVGAGVEGVGNALDNNFMWIAAGLVAVLLLTKK
jgi:hypothetical protein